MQLLKIIIVILQYNMGITKTDLFTQEQNELAQMAKAFAHPARIAILQYLLQANRCINGDLVAELGLAQATISQHLKELKSLEIIQGNVEGTAMCYCINPKVWESIEKRFADLFNQYTPQDSCC
jgi:predicted transcriptional regulator